MQNQRFLATFAPGFEEIIGSLLERALPGAGDFRVSSGMILFSFRLPPEGLPELPFFNNVFLVIQDWASAVMSFSDMASSAVSKNRLAGMPPALRPPAGTSFRVRYSRENQFCSVDKKVMVQAESFISTVTGLAVDRFEPGCEFWFMIRREGFSCFALRLTRRASTEKTLRQGELRPEIVQLVVGLAGTGSGDRVIADPFAGYGSIPEQLLAAGNPGAVIHASDLDPERVGDLHRRFDGRPRVAVHRCDALALDYLASSSVQLVVTDPPWGFWEAERYGGERSVESLYAGFLAELDRVLAPDGRACILTGAKREFEAAVASSAGFRSCALRPGFRTDILVNGKKSAVYRIGRL